MENTLRERLEEMQNRMKQFIESDEPMTLGTDELKDICEFLDAFLYD